MIAMDMRSPVTLLAILSGACWMVVYIEGIRVSFRDRAFAIPFWAISLNFAWEVLHTGLGWRVEGASLQIVINAIWALLDLVILYTWFRFGRMEFRRKWNQAWFMPWSILVLGVSFLLQHLFVIEFGLYPGRAYAAFLQNLVMSVLFIGMLVDRGSNEGQSLLIAVAKWIGTLAPTIVFGFIGGYGIAGPNRFLLMIGLLCSLFDLIYIGLLAGVAPQGRQLAGHRSELR